LEKHDGITNSIIEDFIDTSDIPEITDFSQGRPNPFADKMKKHGFSVTIHYSPEYASGMSDESLRKIINFDISGLDDEEQEALRQYKETQRKRILASTQEVLT